MAIAAVLAWASWIYVIFAVDPTEAGIMSRILFYLTFCLALVGTLSVLGVLYRVKWAKKDQLLIREVRIAFRHAIMLSLAAIISLMLAAKDLLTWWNFLALFVGIGLIEYLFLLMQESRRA
ncbi:MAG TPA: hypothetical protein VFQ60_02115 [Patescibacteria group bacterium]|nr:hypothetical protein [Patescibacteria group bacterium]